MPSGTPHIDNHAEIWDGLISPGGRIFCLEGHGARVVLPGSNQRSFPPDSTRAGLTHRGRASFGMFFLVQKTTVGSDQYQSICLCLPWSDPFFSGRGINNSLQGFQHTNFPVLSLEEKKKMTLSEKLDETGCFRTSRSTAPPLPPFEF